MGGFMPAADGMLQTRISKEIKKEATAILAEIGLTPSDAVRVMMHSIVRHRTVPLDLFEPNEETKAAMLESLNAKPGDLQSASTVDELIAGLNAPD
jgi:DNA-damage-inducible protein J